MQKTKLPDQILVGKCIFFATYLLPACVKDRAINHKWTTKWYQVWRKPEDVNVCEPKSLFWCKSFCHLSSYPLKTLWMEENGLNKTIQGVFTSTDFICVHCFDSQVISVIFTSTWNMKTGSNIEHRYADFSINILSPTQLNVCKVKGRYVTLLRHTAREDYIVMLEGQKSISTLSQ